MSSGAPQLMLDLRPFDIDLAIASARGKGGSRPALDLRVQQVRKDAKERMVRPLKRIRNDTGQRQERR